MVQRESMKETSMSSKKYKLIGIIENLNTLHLLFISILLTTIIVSISSLFFHGEITYDYIVTGLITALIVTGIILKILYLYQDKLKKEINSREKVEKAKHELILDLEDALNNIKKLSGLLPICASCKKIRDDKGYWNQIEIYIKDHSDADFSHSICPDCAKKLYPDFLNKKK